MNLSIEPNADVHFKIRHQDDEILVIDKPQGLVTQPGKGHTTDTLLNGLFAEFGKDLQNLGKDRDFGLLHRLDKHTSGLLIVALRPRGYDAMRKAFVKKTVKKFYWAIAHRAPSKPSGLVSRPIAESTKEEGREGQKLARISSAGKPAVTAYRTLAVRATADKELGGAALLECRPVTGRLHQVRVHLESIGCEILGDSMYARGAMAKAAPRVMLHSHRVVFDHPVTGERLDVRSPCPKDMAAVLRRLGLPVPSVETPSGLAGPEAEAE